MPALNNCMLSCKANDMYMYCQLYMRRGLSCLEHICVNNLFPGRSAPVSSSMWPSAWIANIAGILILMVMRYVACNSQYHGMFYPWTTLSWVVGVPALR